MSVSGISSSSIAAYTPPPTQAQAQAAKTPQSAPKADTVSISKAAQALSSDGDPTALEAQESSASKASEAATGKA